ncbi:MAG: outer-membrane lipoprotein carrier protein LolA [Acidobacteriota bacterium]|nr:outer-membrane lipoprotein carrier protein LolA [Acidobacteriota bacterium]
MKTFLRLSFSAIALTFFFNAFAVTETKAQGPLNEIINRMENHRKILVSLKADVMMDKYNPQLDVHDVTQGNVIYLPGKTERDMYIRINWTKPVQEQLAVIKGEYTLYRPRLGQAITGKVDSAKNSAGAGNALAFMSMSKQQLKANYNVKYLGEETVKSGAQTFRLQLTPKAANKYKSAEIWVDRDGMPVQAKVVENNNDSTSVLLSSLQKNATINARIFTIDYPKKSTKIIKG